MPVVPLKDILDRALAERYGVAAINVFNDLTLEAVLAAAVERRSPLIVQTSVKTVQSIGLDVLYGMWETMTAGIEVPVCLHLDHCPDRDGHHRLPAHGLELRAVRRLAAAGRGKPAPGHRGRRGGPGRRRPRRGRDRGDHRRGGRHRLRRRGAAAVARGGRGLHRTLRRRRLRAVDRQRARRLRRRAHARLRSGSATSSTPPASPSRCTAERA